MYYLWPTIGSVSFVNGIETPKQIKINRAVGHLEIRGKYTILKTHCISTWTDFYPLGRKEVLMILQDGKFEALQGKILEFNGQAGLRWMRRYEKYFKTTCLPTSRMFISVYICVYFCVLFSRSNNWVSTAIASISSEIGFDVLAIFHQGTSFSTGGRRVETGPHWGTAFDETWPFRTNIAWVSCWVAYLEKVVFKQNNWLRTLADLSWVFQSENHHHHHHHHQLDS